MPSINKIAPQKGPQTLFKTGALGAGAKLWVTPGGEYSDWNKKLDWYLNFQISRAKDHKSKEISSKFLENLNEYGIDHNFRKTKSSEFLMISSRGRLPCKMLIIIPYKEDFQNWTQQIHSVWLNLLKPNLRIFLPTDFPINDFSNSWPDKNSISDITLVPSQKINQV